MKFSWVPYPAQIGKLLKIILPATMVVPIFQGRLQGKKWIVGSSNIECILGSYEYEKRILFEKLVPKSSIVYDIGAHVGFYALLASELVGEKGKVIAFEPLPRNLLYLKRHLVLNHCVNVVIIEAAVTDSSGVSSFSEGSTNSMGHLSKGGQITINTISIDEIVKREALPPPNCIKIDIEGTELLALKGAKQTLIDYCPKIFLATHSRKIHIDCCNFLSSLNYKLEPVVGDNLDNTKEILAYKE